MFPYYIACFLFNIICKNKNVKIKQINIISKRKKIND